MGEVVVHDSSLQFGSFNHADAYTRNVAPGDFRDHPLTGHIADMAKATRMTDAVEKVVVLVGRWLDYAVEG